MQPTIKQILVGFIQNLRYFLPDLSKIFKNLKASQNLH